MAIEVDIVANQSNIDSALRKISANLRNLEAESKKVASGISNIAVKNVNSDKVSRELRDLRKEITNTNNELNSSVKQISSSITGVVRNIGIAFASGALTFGFSKLTSQFSDLSNKIALVTGRSDDLVLAQEKILEISNKTYSSVSTTTETFNRFGLALKKANVSNYDLLKVTENVQKALAISGSSADSAAAAIMQLGQGLASGTLRGEELNSVMEQTPRLALAIADELGVSLGGLRDLASQGKVTSKVVMDALLNQGEAINKEFQNITPNMSKATIGLGDAIVNFMGNIDKGLGLSSKIASKIFGLAKAINTFSLDLDLKVADKFEQLNLSKKLKDIQLVSVGVLHVLSAIGKRIGESLPQIIVPVLNYFDKLAITMKNAFVDGLQAMAKGDLQLRAFAFNLIQLGGSIQSAMYAVFNSASPEELRKNLDNLAEAITIFGKRWFNVMNPITTMTRSFNLSLLKLGVSLGILDQKVLRFRFETFQDFGTAIKLVSVIWKEFVANLLVTNLVTNIIKAIILLNQYLIVLRKAFLSTVKDILQAAENYLGQVISKIVDFAAKIRKEFFDLYEYLVGHSVWPDTMKAIIAWTNTMVSVVLAKIKTFTDFIKNDFKAVFADISSFLQSMGSDLINNKYFSSFFSNTISQSKKFIAVLKTTLANSLPSILAQVTTIFEAIKGKLQAVFSMKAKASFSILGSLDSALRFIAKVRDTLTVAIIKAVTNAWSTLADSAPVLGIILASAFAVGLAELLGLALFASVKKLMLGSLIAKSISSALGDIGPKLLDSGFFGDLGAGLGILIGSIANAIVENIPFLVKAFEDAATGFRQAFLDSFGFIGQALNKLLNLGSGGILDTVLFGAGIAVLLGKFKWIQTILQMGIAAMFGGDVEAAAGKEGGLLSLYLFGKNTKSVLSIIALVYTTLTAIPKIFTDFPGAIKSLFTVGGSVALMLFGATGTIKGIIKSIDFIGTYLMRMAGITSASLNIAGLIWPTNATPGLMRRATVWFRWFRRSVRTEAGRINLLEGMLAQLRPTLTYFTVGYMTMMARLRAWSVSLGGPLGTVGSVLFGRAGSAIILAATILGFFASVANASDSLGEAVSSISWAEWGILGLTVFGLLGPTRLTRMVTTVMQSISNTYKAVYMSMAISAASQVGTSLLASVSMWLTGIGAVVLSWIGTFFAFVFSWAGLGIAAVGIIGLALFGEGNTIWEKLHNLKEGMLDFWTGTTAGGREARKTLESVLEPLKGAAIDGLKLDMTAALAGVDLSGVDPNQFRDMKVSLKTSVSRLEEIKQAYEDEGKITRTERREANELLRGIRNKLEEAPKAGSAASTSGIVKLTLASLDKAGLTQNIGQKPGVLNRFNPFFGMMESFFGKADTRPTMDTAAGNITGGKALLGNYIDFSKLKANSPDLVPLVEALQYAVDSGLEIPPEVARNFNESLADLLNVDFNPFGIRNKESLVNYMSEEGKKIYNSAAATLGVEEKLALVREAQLRSAQEAARQMGIELSYSSGKQAKEEAIARIIELQKKAGLETLSVDQQKLLTAEGAYKLQKLLSEGTNQKVATPSGKIVNLFDNLGFDNKQLASQRERILKEFQLTEKILLSKSGELVDNANGVLSELGVNITLTSLSPEKLDKLFKGQTAILDAQAAAAIAGNSDASLKAVEQAKRQLTFSLMETKDVFKEVVGGITQNLTDLSVEDILMSSLGSQSIIDNLGRQWLRLNDIINSKSDAFQNLPLRMKQALVDQRSTLVEAILAAFKQAANEINDIDWFGNSNTIKNSFQEKLSSLGVGNIDVGNIMPMSVVNPQDVQQATADLKNLDEVIKGLQIDIKNGTRLDFKASIDDIVSVFYSAEEEFTTFTDKLDYARSLVDNPIDLGGLLKLPRSKLNEISDLTSKLRMLQFQMIAIKLFGAITGSDIVEPLGAVLAKIDETTKLLNTAVPDAPKKDAKEKAKNWWEEFSSTISDMSIEVSPEYLAGLNGDTIKKLSTASLAYKNAQEAINKSTVKDTVLRQKSLEIMKQQKEIALSLIDNGTFAGAKNKLAALGSTLDESVISMLNKAQLASAESISKRISNLTMERDAMEAGSASQIKATWDIKMLNMSLDALSEQTMMLPNAFDAVTESFQSGLSEMLKGEASFSDFIHGILDTFTNSIIDSFSKIITDKIFSSVGGSAMSFLSGALGFASGGRVAGPGSGTSDSIASWLSNGEFVVNADSTKKWLPFLEHINNNDKMPAFAAGGQVGPVNAKVLKVATGGKGSSQQVYNINVTGDVSRQTRSEIVKMIPEITSGVNITNRERGSR